LPIFAALKQDAQVAKLVDALCSGRSVSNHVLVRIQSWAQAVPTKSEWLFCFSEASLLAGANKQKRQAMRSIATALGCTSFLDRRRQSSPGHENLAALPMYSHKSTSEKAQPR
jgi:hypothetical protein